MYNTPEKLKKKILKRKVTAECEGLCNVLNDRKKKPAIVDINFTLKISP